MTSEIKKLIKALRENERKWRNSDDYSVYTGLAGIAYALHHYGKHYNDSICVQVFLIKFNMLYFDLRILYCCIFSQTAMELLDNCTKGAKIKSRPKITFLTGVAGPFALTAVLLHSQGKTEEAKELILKYANVTFKITMKKIRSNFL